MKSAKEFLVALEQRFPPERQHLHPRLTVDDGKLILTMFRGDTYEQFVINDNELNDAVDGLVAQVASFIEAAG